MPFTSFDYFIAAVACIAFAMLCLGWPLHHKRVRGDRIRFGLSIERSQFGRVSILLRLPIFVWYGNHYDVSTDNFTRGWRLLNVGMRFATLIPGQLFVLSAGWTAVGTHKAIVDESNPLSVNH